MRRLGQRHHVHRPADASPADRLQDARPGQSDQEDDLDPGAATNAREGDQQHELGVGTDLHLPRHLPEVGRRRAHMAVNGRVRNAHPACTVCLLQITVTRTNAGHSTRIANARWYVQTECMLNTQLMHAKYTVNTYIP